ncbi:MAG TPA: hypothetical protein DCL44_00520 [Elusimicrobia bacterium]|nr:hypothetical protein [Elusimicrobiota bacterium]
MADANLLSRGIIGSPVLTEGVFAIIKLSVGQLSLLSHNKIIGFPGGFVCSTSDGSVRMRCQIKRDGRPLSIVIDDYQWALCYYYQGPKTLPNPAALR